jgi:hypothetical protein
MNSGRIMMRSILAGAALLLASIGTASAAGTCTTTDEAYTRLVWLEHAAMEEYLDQKVPPDRFATLFNDKLPGLDEEVNDSDPAVACQDIDKTAQDFGVDLGWYG